jgi:hypothetical protein
MSVSVLALVSAINDAASVMTALSPLVSQAMSQGKTSVTVEDIQKARAAVLSNIDSLDKLIEKYKQPK